MASGTASGGLLRGVFEGSIAAGDTVVERRPYHRNCGCALHDRSRAGGACSPSHCRNRRVSFPMRRAWSEGNLALAVPRSSSSCCSSSRNNSPSNSPALAGIAATARKSTTNLPALDDTPSEEY